MPLPSVVNELCPEKRSQDSPLPAEPHARKTGVTENKKPGIKRRAIPSTPSQGRTCSKLDCFLSGVRNQSHLVISGEITGPPGPPGVPGLPTSGKYTYFSLYVKSDAKLFYRVSSIAAVNFRAAVEIKPLAKLMISRRKVLVVQIAGQGSSRLRIMRARAYAGDLQKLLPIGIGD